MFARIYKYNQELNSYDVIKFIAIIAMIIDHIGYYFIIENADYWRAIGRLAAPLFFFIAGYVFKYQIRINILFYGIIITLVGFDVGYGFHLNILIVIASIKWILERWNPSQEDTLNLVIIFIFLYLGHFWVKDILEYGFLGFAYAFCGRLLAMKTKPILVTVFLAGTLLIHLFEPIFFNDNIYVAITFSIVAILLYLMMTLFRYKVFSVKPLIKNSLLIFSRYSLEIYFWHLYIFEVIFQVVEKN